MNVIVDPKGPRLSDTPSNPIPPGAHVSFFETTDHVKLRYGIWRHAKKGSKGTVCLVHGRTEFIEKYYETIADLMERGFSVATFDWRGQGGSDRLTRKQHLGYVDKFEDYVTDLTEFHRSILLPECPPPFYLVGHSMGSLVSLMAGIKNRLMFDRMFLSAPMLAIPAQPLSMGGMANLTEYMCMAGLGTMPIGRRSDKKPTEQSFAGNHLTSDFTRYMRVVEVLADQPDLAIGAPSVRWLASAFRAMARAGEPDFPGKISLPVLMLAAARDQVVSTAAIEHMGLSMRVGRHVLIANSRHEMFVENDDVRGEVFAAFDAFITEQTL